MTNDFLCFLIKQSIFLGTWHFMAFMGNIYYLCYHFRLVSFHWASEAGSPSLLPSLGIFLRGYVGVGIVLIEILLSPIK